MPKHNHTCKVCGKGYNACDTCLNEKNYAPWRAIACTQGHFQAYMVLYEFDSGTLSKADAMEMLSKVDIEGWENYPEVNRVLIEKILKTDEQIIAVHEPSPEMDKLAVVEEPKAADVPKVATVAPQQVYAPKPKDYQYNYPKHKR